MTKTKIVAYWVTTALVAASMLSGGIAHVLRVPDSVETFVRLGYPLHFVTLLGVWKILGALALLAPRFPRLKEWAYAGIAFDLSGAVVAWGAVGASDSVSNVGHMIIPLIGLALAATSWALRPDSRRLAS